MRAATQDVIAKAVPGYGLSSGALWRHSIAATLAAEVAAGFIGPPVSPFSLTAALLHDIGKLVMGQFLTNEMLFLCAMAVKEGGLQPFQAEAEILTLHHGEVGGIIAQHWQLPQEIVDSVTHHHAPEGNPSNSTFVVYLANVVANHLEGRPIGSNAEKRTFEAATDSLGLGSGDFEKICSATSELLTEALSQAE